MEGHAGVDQGQSHRSAVQELVTSLTCHQESASNRKYIHHRIRQLACVFNYVDPIQSIWSQVKYSARVYVYLVFPNGELREIEFGGEAEEEQIYLCLSPNCGD